LKIHLVAICGTGMGSLAGLLKEAGHEVQGSDRAFYPPMSERLRAWGIPTMQGFDPGHLTPGTDLVVVGNACRKDNPEAVAAKERGLRVMSFPQALSELFIAGRKSIVVAGTHGKTTTSALLSYLLVESGMDPSFLVGGIPQNFDKSFRLGSGAHFVVEGDEYDSAYFDKRPKFLHYRPEIGVITSVEFDHADIYADMHHYRAAFSEFVAQIPESGLLVACDDDPEVLDQASRAVCRVVSYGLGVGAGWRASDLVEGEVGASFVLGVDGQRRLRIEVPLSGRHNVQNTLAALAVADHVGLPPERASGLLAGFGGVARRMQVRGVAAGITVIDDFAHHPTEVAETVNAARRRYLRSRLVAVFEPRTNTSRRSFFQKRYAESFGGADLVVLVPPFDSANIPAEERFDSDRLVGALRNRGQDASLCADADDVQRCVRRYTRKATGRVRQTGRIMIDVLWVILWIVVALALIKLHNAFWTNYFDLRRRGDQVHYADTEDGWQVALHRYIPVERRYAEPVLLCHGMGANRNNFDLMDDRSLARDLRDRGFDVWSLELRGAGFSGRPKWYQPHRWTFRFEDYLEKDVRAALSLVREASGSDRVFWVGHSMGGLLGYAWLGKRGDHGLAGLVAVSAPLLLGQSRTVRILRPFVWAMTWTRVVAFRPSARFFSPFMGWPPGLLSRVSISKGGMRGPVLRRCMVNLVENSTAALLRQFLQWSRAGSFAPQGGEDDYLANLEKIEEPVLIMAADGDKLASPGSVTPAYQRVRSADKQLRIFGGDRGDDCEFGHGDILLGENVREVVFPEIIDWLESRASVWKAQS
jgi:UDP-N-acetylmuramate: L-alanyl-gamma-D-glutamyl-meso-diaminopimelate ligase